MLRATLILLSLLLFALGAQAQDAPTATPQQETITYTIQWNDSLGAIAARYRTSVVAIMRLNNLNSSEMIVAGQTLLIPVPATPQPAETPTEVPPVADVPAETAEPTPEIVLPLIDPTASLPAFDYGVEAYFDNQDASTVVQQITAIGMHWAKVRVSWRALEPVQGSIDFTPLDAIVDALSANNLHILLTVSNAPDWSRSSPVESGPPDNFDDFAAFSSTVAARYAGRVQAYEIWHEPNLRREWNNPLYPVSPQHYAELLRRAYVAIKLADENAIVLSAGLAPTGFNDGINAIDDRIFLDQLYEQGLAGISDAISAHPFGFANPPDALCCQASPGVLTHFEHPSFYFANTLQDYRNIMLANDDPLTNIWVTEFGWGTSEDMSAPTEGNSFIGDNTRAEQAQYISRAFELGAGLGYVRVMIAYSLNSCVAQPNNTDACYYSLLDASGQPRAAYNTLGMMFLPALES
jgi:LysM repeat protein